MKNVISIIIATVVFIIAVVISATLNRKSNQENMEEKYILVCWPESQILMEQTWFDECILMNDENHLQEIGSSAYFVPENRIINLKTN